MEIVAKENQITVLDHEECTWVEKTSEDPLGEPSKIASNWQPVPIDGLLDEDGFGIFLMTLRYTEKKKLPFSAVPDDDEHLPDIHLGLDNDVLVFDHVSKVLLPPVAFLFLILLLLKLPSGSVDMSISQYGHNLAVYNFSYEQFKDAILKVKEHIFAGDIFQMVLSQCFERGGGEGFIACGYSWPHLIFLGKNAGQSGE
ncbi:unnamed protein product [Sphagnum jensenii]|uniref:Uncharacterized protein n=1 Tax=Sphagnum jensenii TaxID=128206 RepID=A0ABP1AM14_9BRYO